MACGRMCRLSGRRALAKQGHEIGSHSMTHPDLVTLADEEALRRELSESRDLLAEQVCCAAPPPTPPRPPSSREWVEMV